MSVVGQAQIMDRPRGSFELGKYTITVPYKVVVNSLNDGPIVVASAPGLPLIFSPYVFGNETNVTMRLRRWQSEPIGTPPTLVWKVEAIYETPPHASEGRGRSSTGPSGGGSGRENAGEFLNPLLEIPSVKFHSSGREALLTRIYDNITGTFKPCAASNGEIFDPPPKYLEPYATLEITRNEPIGSPQPYIALTYANALNNDTFWGFGSGYWRVKEIVPERQDRQIPNSPFKFAFLRVTYSFEFNPNKWDISLLDYGSYYWDRVVGDPTATGAQILATRRQIVTREGHPTQAPLNGNGRPIPDRAPYTATVQTPADATHRVLQINPTTPPQQFNAGDIVQLSGIPLAAGGQPTPPTPLTYNTVYYVVDLLVDGDGTQHFNLSTTSDPANRVTTTDNGSGWQYVYSPGVFFTVRPYARLNFAALRLPQSFALVQ